MEKYTNNSWVYKKTLHKEVRKLVKITDKQKNNNQNLQKFLYKTYIQEKVYIHDIDTGASGTEQ